MLARYALLCMLGEHVDLTTLQVYWLNQVYHDRPSDMFSFREWVLQLAEAKNGLADLLTRKFARERLKINTWHLNRVEKNQILEEMRATGEAIRQNTKKIELLFGRCPIGYKGKTEFGPKILEVYLDLATVTLREMVKHGLMRPITAARFLMITRPCEHVMLTPTMLRWAARVPAVLGIPKKHRRKLPPASLPAVAPEDATTYLKYEYVVRRLQRTYFHDRTSLEAHVLIHESELEYERKTQHLVNAAG